MALLQSLSALAIKGLARGVVEVIGVHGAYRTLDAVADALYKSSAPCPAFGYDR